MTKVPSKYHEYRQQDYPKTQKRLNKEHSENVINALIQESQYRGGWISVKEFLPPTADGICVAVLNDDTASNFIIGSVQNSAWFCKNYEKEHWTHWMILPMRPSDLQTLSNYYFDIKEYDKKQKKERDWLKSAKRKKQIDALFGSGKKK